MYDVRRITSVKMYVHDVTGQVKMGTIGTNYEQIIMMSIFGIVSFKFQ